MPKFIISGVDRIKQLFGMYALNLFLREVFMLRLAIKCISTSMGTVKNTLDKTLWGQTIVRILDQSWTNTNPFIYMRNLNISYFFSFGGRKGYNDTIALLGLKTPPPLVENWMLWSKGKVALIVPVGFLCKISKYGNPCRNSDCLDDFLAKLIT